MGRRARAIREKNLKLPVMRAVATDENGNNYECNSQETMVPVIAESNKIRQEQCVDTPFMTEPLLSDFGYLANEENTQKVLDGEYVPPEPEGPVIPEHVSQHAAREGIALHSHADVKASKGGALVFPTGTLNLEQIKGIFSVLPVDLTFVDADDRVRFFTEGADRVFVRPKAIIGRKVEHCHPPSSVHVVEQILSDFRSGSHDVAEFWIEYRGRFINIRYFAVRDGEGSYLGTLEVTQDLTHQRQLSGERRLLSYD